MVILKVIAPGGRLGIRKNHHEAAVIPEQSKVLIELEESPPLKILRQIGEIIAGERHLRGNAGQGQQCFRDIDLADYMVFGSLFNPGSEQSSGNMEILHRHEIAAAGPSIVIRNHKKDRILEIRLGLNSVIEASQSIVRIAHGIFPASGSTPGKLVRNLKGVVIGGGEYQRVKQPAGLMLFIEMGNGLIEEILVGDSPGGDEFRIVVAVDINDGVVAVPQEEGSHIVKMRFAAVNEGGAVALLPEQTAEVEKVFLGFFPLYHGGVDGGGKAGGYGLNASYGAHSGGVKFGEAPAFGVDPVKLGSEVAAAESFGELRSEAFLKNDHNVELSLPIYRGEDVQGRMLLRGRSIIKTGVLLDKSEDVPGFHGLISVLIFRQGRLHRCYERVTGIRCQVVDNLTGGKAGLGQIEGPVFKGGTGGDKVQTSQEDKHEDGGQDGGTSRLPDAPQSPVQEHREGRHQRGYGDHCRKMTPEHQFNKLLRVNQILHKQPVGSYRVFLHEGEGAELQKEYQETCQKKPALFQIKKRLPGPEGQRAAEKGQEHRQRHKVTQPGNIGAETVQKKPGHFIKIDDVAVDDNAEKTRQGVYQNEGEDVIQNMKIGGQSSCQAFYQAPGCRGCAGISVRCGGLIHRRALALRAMP